MKKSILIIILLAILTTANAQITKLHWSQVETVKFGNEITYQKIHNYDINNPDKPRKLLHGNYKIADDYGAYSEINFKEGKVNGTWKDYDFEGRLKSLSHFEEGKFEGKNIEYYQNGEVSKEVFYKKGKASGIWKEYNREGKVTSVEHYKNGLKEGKWEAQVIRSEKLNCKKIEFYENDKPVGIWKEICDNKLTWTKEFSGEKDYVEKMFFSNGKINTEKRYKNGKMDGAFKAYERDGVLIKFFTFNEGIAMVKKLYYSNANLKSISNYKNSKIHGVYKTFYENGKKKLEAFYTESYKSGTWKKYTDEGKLRSIMRYKNGLENGPFKQYFRTGILEKEGSYVKGRPEGLWKMYGRDGKLFKEVIYENGRITSEKKYK